MARRKTEATTRNNRKKRFLAALAGALALLLGAPAFAQTITTERVTEAETEAGNIVADAVRAAGGAEMALIAAGSFKRGAQASRPASPEQATGLLERADDTVVVLSVRGARLLEALERAVAFAPQKSDGFLQVSGMKFTYNPDKPGGKRVLSAAANGAPIEAARTYKIATTQSLASGQYGYFRIWDKGDISAETQKTLAEALRALAGTRGGSLVAPVEGRIAARNG